MTTRQAFLRHGLAFARDERGATAIEYALIAGIVSVAIVAALGVMGSQLANMLNNVGNDFPAN